MLHVQISSKPGKTHIGVAYFRLCMYVLMTRGVLELQTLPHTKYSCSTSNTCSDSFRVNTTSQVAAPPTMRLPSETDTAIWRTLDHSAHVMIHNAADNNVVFCFSRIMCVV